MKNLVQIIYISRSTFEITDIVNKIEPNIVRILTKSRSNNRKNGLVGVLYFGDGAFFQCLEGDEDAINTLFSKIEKDPRHKDIKIISKKSISKFSFPDWAMKYAPLDEKMGVFLKENGYGSFDPYAFTPEITQKVLRILIDADDPTNETDVLNSGSVVQQSILNSGENPSKKLIILSLIFSIIACTLASAALLSARGLI